MAYPEYSTLQSGTRRAPSAGGGGGKGGRWKRRAGGLKVHLGDAELLGQPEGGVGAVAHCVLVDNNELARLHISHVLRLHRNTALSPPAQVPLASLHRVTTTQRRHSRWLLPDTRCSRPHLFMRPRLLPRDTMLAPAPPDGFGVPGSSTLPRHLTAALHVARTRASSRLRHHYGIRTRPKRNPR